MKKVSFFVLNYYYYYFFFLSHQAMLTSNRRIANECRCSELVTFLLTNDVHHPQFFKEQHFVMAPPSSYRHTRCSFVSDRDKCLMYLQCKVTFNSIGQTTAPKLSKRSSQGKEVSKRVYIWVDWGVI